MPATGIQDQELAITLETRQSAVILSGQNIDRPLRQTILAGHAADLLT